MLSSKTLTFTPNSILTHAMLDELRRMPLEFLQLHYGSYSDGIIAGFEVFEHNNDIIFSPGVLKLNGRFYFSSESISIIQLLKEKGISIENTCGQHYAVTLSPSETNSLGGITEYCLIETLRKIDSFDSIDNMFILGEFSDELINDLKLPKIEIDCSNFTREFSLTNSRFRLAAISWATSKGSTFHPYIFRAVQNILLEKAKTGLSVADTMLLLQITNQGIVSMESLRAYIVLSGLDLPNNSTRSMIIEKLAKVLATPPPRYLSDVGSVQQKVAKTNKQPVNRLVNNIDFC